MTLCTNNTPSTNEYTGNGAITEYSITFQYYSQSDIFVAFYDTATEAWVTVSTSDWSFLNPTVIKFNTAPADNQRILIYRCTDIDPLPAEFFPGNSIKAADLNNNFFVMKSAIEEINTQAGSSDSLAQSAKATADAANTKADTAISTANTASTNASSAVTTANTADTNATSALNAANSATATANTALSTANTANTTANTANTTANTANTAATAASSDASAAVSSANAAVTTANAADTNATTALNTANTVSGVANTANTNATTALNTANTALTTANTANTTANNALSQVSASNPWQESSGNVSLLNSGSQVGIGLTNPIFPLEVSRTGGGTVVSSFKSDQSTAFVNIASTSTDLLNVRFGAAGNDAVIHAGGSEKVRVRSNGHLGIGTSTPSFSLETRQTNGGGSVVGAGITNNSSDAGTSVKFNLAPSSASGGIRAAELEAHNDGLNAISLGFNTSNGSTPVERMRISPVGNVGVGTTTPSQKLEVAGNVSVVGGGNLFMQTGARVQF
ncbi:MAG: hypothetical protein CMF11_03285, partial [Idiomarina sp.]|nr:hypothetical protein [Idiomarina sp.]